MDNHKTFIDKWGALEAIINDSLWLEDDNEDIWDDKEIVLAEVQNDGSALRYASERLQNKLRK